MPIEDTFRDGFQLIGKAVGTDSGGAITEGAPTVLKEFSARTRPLSGNEMIQNEKKGYITTHKIYCYADVPATNELQIYDTVKDKTYDIKLIVDPMEAGEFLQVDCECKNE